MKRQCGTHRMCMLCSSSFPQEIRSLAEKRKVKEHSEGHTKAELLHRGNCTWLAGLWLWKTKEQIEAVGCRRKHERKCNFLKYFCWHALDNRSSFVYPEDEAMNNSTAINLRWRWKAYSWFICSHTYFICILPLSDECIHLTGSAVRQFRIICRKRKRVSLQKVLREGTKETWNSAHDERATKTSHMIKVWIKDRGKAVIVASCVGDDNDTTPHAPWKMYVVDRKNMNVSVCRCVFLYSWKQNLQARIVHRQMTWKQQGTKTEPFSLVTSVWLSPAFLKARKK